MHTDKKADSHTHTHTHTHTHKHAPTHIHTQYFVFCNMLVSCYVNSIKTKYILNYIRHNITITSLSVPVDIASLFLGITVLKRVPFGYN